MKKIFAAAFAAIASLFAMQAEAQSQFQKSDFALNLDYNLGKFTANDFGWSGGNSTTQHGFSLMGEKGIMNVINEKGVITVGGQLGLGLGSESGVNHTRVRIATRGTLHYSFIPQIDTYAGVTFCFFDINKVKWDDDYFEGTGIEVKSSETEVHFIEPRLFAGARYMFSSSLGANMEFSWDHFALLSVGLSFKF